MNLTKNKELAEQSALNLRCSGVRNARVVQVIAYEIVSDPVFDDPCGNMLCEDCHIGGCPGSHEGVVIPRPPHTPTNDSRPCPVMQQSDDEQAAQVMKSMERPNDIRILHKDGNTSIDITLSDVTEMSAALQAIGYSKKGILSHLWGWIV